MLPDYSFLIGAIVIGLFVLLILIALFLRRVVPTNEVHIVQSGKSTVSYGKDHNARMALKCRLRNGRSTYSGGGLPATRPQSPAGWRNNLSC